MSVPVSSDPLDDIKLRQNARLLRNLVKETHFNQHEVEAVSVIYFKFLNENNSSNVKRTSMERNQLREIFQTCFNINDDFLIDRAFLYLDKGITSAVSLETWIRILSLFFRGTQEEKMKYCYFVYDVNGDDKIKRNEVIQLFGKCFITENVEDGELAVKDLADIMVRKLDLDADGLISFSDYSNSVLRQYELLEVFGRCLPDRKCISTFMHTFTDEDIRF